MLAVFASCVQPRGVLEKRVVEGPWTRHTIDSTSRGADGVRLADVNGDSLADVVTGWEEGGLTRLYVNPGPAAVAGVWPYVTVASIASPEDAVAVDVDGDGAFDVVTAAEGTNRKLYVSWAPTRTTAYLDSAAWTTEPLPAPDRQWMYTQPVPSRGDGLELVVGSKNDSAEVGVITIGKYVQEQAYRGLSRASWIMSLELVDVDEDGDSDILLTDRKGEDAGVYWLENPSEKAAAGGAWKRHLVGAAGREVMFLDWSDLESDGKNEVLVAVKASEVVTFRRPDSPTERWSESRIALPSGIIGTAKAVRAADIDLDGRKDFVLSFEDAAAPKSGVVWMRKDNAAGHSERSRTPGIAVATSGDGSATWRVFDVSGPAGQKFDLIQLVDLDEDGDLDIITCEESDNLGVVWYENPYGNESETDP